MPQTLTGIANNKISEVVQSFIDNDGAIKVTAEKESDGTWRVTAYLP